MVFHLLGTTNPSKVCIIFFKIVAHNCRRENKPNNAENWSWLIGQGPLHLT